MQEYDEIAEWFTAVRNPDVGVSDLAAFARALPAGARILDLGCGDGVPVSRFLLRKGFELTALDNPTEMIERYRANFADVPAHRVRVQDARFAPGTFDAVVAQGVLFHLDETDQAAATDRVTAWLRPGGRFLFTSGDAREVVESEMNGVTFRYVSLGADVYRSLLEDAGMRLEHHYTDAWANHVYVAAKAAELHATGRTRM